MDAGGTVKNLGIKTHNNVTKYTDQFQFVEQTKADFLPLGRAQLYALYQCIAFVHPHKQRSIRVPDAPLLVDGQIVP